MMPVRGRATTKVVGGGRVVRVSAVYRDLQETTLVVRTTYVVGGLEPCYWFFNLLLNACWEIPSNVAAFA